MEEITLSNIWAVVAWVAAAIVLLAKALEAAADMLTANGITVTDLELRMLLEAAVGEFNDVFAKPLPILEGFAVEDLDDDQLREVLVQAGLSRTYTDGLTREQLLAAPMIKSVMTRISATHS